MRFKQKVAAALAALAALGAGFLIVGPGIASASDGSQAKDEIAGLKAVVSDLRAANEELRGENDDLKGLVSDLRDRCYEQANRLYDLSDKPDLTFPEELNLMQAKTLAGSWLESCKEIAPEDVEAVTGIFGVAQTALDQAVADYRAATETKKK